MADVEGVLQDLIDLREGADEEERPRVEAAITAVRQINAPDAPATETAGAVVVAGQFPPGSVVSLYRVDSETVLRAEGGELVSQRVVDDSGNVGFDGLNVGERFFVTGYALGNYQELRASAFDVANPSSSLSQAPVQPAPQVVGTQQEKVEEVPPEPPAEDLPVGIPDSVPEAAVPPESEAPAEPAPAEVTSAPAEPEAAAPAEAPPAPEPEAPPAEPAPAEAPPAEAAPTEPPAPAAEAPPAEVPPAPAEPTPEAAPPAEATSPPTPEAAPPAEAAPAPAETPASEPAPAPEPAPPVVSPGEAQPPAPASEGEQVGTDPAAGPPTP